MFSRHLDRELNYFNPRDQAHLNYYEAGGQPSDIFVGGRDEVAGRTPGAPEGPGLVEDHGDSPGRRPDPGPLARALDPCLRKNSNQRNRLAEPT